MVFLMRAKRANSKSYVSAKNTVSNYIIFYDIFVWGNRFRAGFAIITKGILAEAIGDIIELLEHYRECIQDAASLVCFLLGMTIGEDSRS